MPSGGLLRVEATDCVLQENELTDQPETNPGHYVRTDVRDTGTGIPAEVLEKIWQPFFTTKDEGKGTGLGLSTVHGIIETHHGFVRLNTQLGEGTCFSVYLPVAE